MLRAPIERFPLPYIDVGVSPPKKHGKVYGAGTHPPDAPSCPECKTNKAVFVQTPAVRTADNTFESTVYFCAHCRRNFKAKKR